MFSVATGVARSANAASSQIRGATVGACARSAAQNTTRSPSRSTARTASMASYSSNRGAIDEGTARSDRGLGKDESFGVLRQRKPASGSYTAIPSNFTLHLSHDPVPVPKILPPQRSAVLLVHPPLLQFRFGGIDESAVALGVDERVYRVL